MHGMPGKKACCNAKIGFKMTKVWIKVQAVMQEDKEELVVGACDFAYLGKRIIDGKVEFYVSKQFFGGELVEIEKMIAVVKKATIANLVGEECVNAAISAGLVDQSNVKKIKNIPHVQIIQM